jgi:hypothetical protein
VWSLILSEWEYLGVHGNLEFPSTNDVTVNVNITFDMYYFKKVLELFQEFVHEMGKPYTVFAYWISSYKYHATFLWCLPVLVANYKRQWKNLFTYTENYLMLWWSITFSEIWDKLQGTGRGGGVISILAIEYIHCTSSFMVHSHNTAHVYNKCYTFKIVRNVIQCNVSTTNMDNWHASWGLAYPLACKVT